MLIDGLMVVEKMSDELWNDYLNINEYRMSDYDIAVIKIIESIESFAHLKSILLCAA